MTGKKHNSIRKLLIGSALMTALPLGALAQQAAPGAAGNAATEEEIRRYAVELIVFEYSDGAAGSKEIFQPDLPADEYQPDRFGDPAIRAGDSANATSEIPVEVDELAVASRTPVREEELEEFVTYEHIGLKVLTPVDYQLDDLYNRLDRLDAYRPLMRAAWTQPTLEQGATRPIKLRILGNPPLRLDGTVTLYLNRFLHLVVDLSLEDKSPYRGPTPYRQDRAVGSDSIRSPFGFGARSVTPSVFYRIEEDRIVRNGELRYYDHPKFGVIAKITRVEEEQTRPATDDTSDLLPGS